MGVALVFEYHATAKEVERMFEVAGAKLFGTYSVDCLPYRPSNALALTIPMNYVLHHSYFPQSSFSIVPHGYYVTSPRATSDRGFDLILAKLSSGLIPDYAGKFELSGQKYRLRDFVVRIGTASQGTTVKGTIIEVEYEPSEMACQARYLLKEFIAMFFSDYKTIKISEVLDKDTPETYTPLETLYQYLRIFLVMRNRTVDSTS